ncbi:MAG: FAD-binding protein [Gammaproteobacteria bacterium]|nr:FAD-binding protein [Gammaproteobacteria bacterium]
MMPQNFINQCFDVVGKDALLVEKEDCWAYGFDNSRRHGLPDAVAFPKSHQQVRDLVKLCFTHNTPVTARGRGTGTTGAATPVNGGLVISFEKMDQIIKIDPDNRTIVVQPGVTNKAIQDKAAEYGFFWPPDPTSAEYCTVGGNLAYNSAGPRAVKYGTPRENTLALKAVIGTGEEIKTGTYTTKGVVGYDLTRLLIGSEGTLAIITEATLKLTPLPESKKTIQAVYRDIKSATKAIANIMAQPLTPCALEFIDNKAIEMVRHYSKADLPQNAGALLMIEIDGQREFMTQAIDAIKQSSANEGLVSFIAAETEDEIKLLWDTRKALSPALRNIAPKKINEDVVVPVSCIPDLISGLEQLSDRYNITIVNFGHAGNGNIHVNLLMDPDDPVQMKNAEACLDEVFDLVLKLNGSLSGEHGVGMEKRNFINREIDPVSLDLMKKIKHQFDPKGILNPGKMFP